MTPRFCGSEAVKSFIMTNHRRGLVLSAVLLSGCGIDPVRELKDQAGLLADPVVKLATAADIADSKVVEASYIVTFRAAKGSALLRFPSYGAEYDHHFALLAERYLADPRVQDINYITTVDLANPKDPGLTEDLSPPRALRLLWNEDTLDDLPGTIAEVTFADAASAAPVLAEWEAQGLIWFAEPNYTNDRMDNPFNQAMIEAYKGVNAWWHTQIKLDKALEKLAGMEISEAQATVVAVLDSGLDVENPGIKDQVWVNERPGSSGCPDDVNGCDTTVSKKKVLGSGNVAPYLTGGYNLPCPGADAAQGTPEYAEKGVCEHGTHVSGIIAATPSGEIGGVCPVCKIMMIKIIKGIKGKGQAPDSAILNGFKYLTLFRNNSSSVVRVANSSFGKYVRARSVALLVSVLKKPPNEILVVGAAGNEDSMLRTYPAALNDAIAVSATRTDMGKATYSNFGPWVDVAAPGGDGASAATRIISTVPGGTGDKQGTSMACPVVAGVAGLVLSVDPGRGFQKLRNSILDTADPTLYNPDVYGGINRIYYPKLTGDNVRRPLLGHGVVDALAAIDGTAKSGIESQNLRRVNRGCSVVGTGGEPSGASFWLVLSAPLLFAAWRIRKFSRRFGEN